MITLLLSDTQQNIPIAYNEQLKVQQIFERLQNQRNYSSNMRLLHNGRVLNTIKDMSFKESGLKPGDTVYVLNHLKYNHIHEQLKTSRQTGQKKQLINSMISQKDKFQQVSGTSKPQVSTTTEQEQTKKRTWRDMLFKWPGTSSNQNSGEDSQSSGEKKKLASSITENTQKEVLPEERIDLITPELIAKVTDARTILKPKPAKSQFSFGHGDGQDDFMNFFQQILQRAGAPEQDQSNALGQIAQERSIFARDREAERQARHERRRQEQQEADPAKVQNLVEMGFEEERSKKVLKHFKNNMNMAMDYIINTPPENDQILSSDSAAQSDPQHTHSVATFTPNEDSLKMLMEMGYEREDSIYALRVTANNLEQACTYLLSNPNPSQNQASSSVGISSRLFGNWGSSQPAASRQQPSMMSRDLGDLRNRQDHIRSETNRIEQALQRIMRATEQFNQMNNQQSASFRAPGRGFASNFGSANSADHQ
eukprot:403335791